MNSKKRPVLASVTMFIQSVSATISTVYRQLGWAAVPITIALLVLALVAIVTAAAPILIPFVYPLF